MTGSLDDLAVEFHAPEDSRWPSLALFSKDYRYRYRLSRQWADQGPTAVFIMLNPSVADAFKSDPTVTRCRGFAEREGCKGLVVLNLFALRSPDPKVLAPAADPVGPFNDAQHQAVLTGWPGDLLVIAAWGAHPFATKRAADVTRRVARRHPLLCLGTTKAGHPRHPLYVKGDAPLVTYADQAGVIA